MGEPIVMYDRKGRSVTVYGKAQAAVMVADEGWTFEPPTAAKPDVSEAVSVEPVSEDAVEAVSVEKSVPVKTGRTSARKGSKGKEL